MSHTTRMVKEFYANNDQYKYLIVSPCLAKKREFEAIGTGDYNVTMNSFYEYFKENHINYDLDIEQYLVDTCWAWRKDGPLSKELKSELDLNSKK